MISGENWPAVRTASRVACSIIKELRSNRPLFRVLGSFNHSSITWPAVRHRVLETSNAVTGETQSDPFRRLFKFSALSPPKGETIPYPVIKTRCIFALPDIRTNQFKVLHQSCTIDNGIGRDERPLVQISGVASQAPDEPEPVPTDQRLAAGWNNSRSTPDLSGRSLSKPGSPPKRCNPPLAIFSFKFNKIGLTQPRLISYTAKLIAWITDPMEGSALARGRRKDIKFRKLSLSLQRPQSRMHFWSEEV